jgi:hypothetical protein
MWKNVNLWYKTVRNVYICKEMLLNRIVCVGGGAKTVPSDRKMGAKTGEFSDKYNKPPMMERIYPVGMFLSRVRIA